VHVLSPCSSLWPPRAGAPCWRPVLAPRAGALCWRPVLAPACADTNGSQKCPCEACSPLNPSCRVFPPFINLFFPSSASGRAWDPTVVRVCCMEPLRIRYRYFLVIYDDI